MRISEVVSRNHPNPVGHGHETARPHHRSRPLSVQPVADDVRPAAKTLVEYLQSLENAKFVIYSNDLKPILLGETHNGMVYPADLEKRLLRLTATGFSIDLQIGDTVRTVRPWSKFNDHVAVPDAVVEGLLPFDVVCVMREQTPLRREVIERLPRLKLIASTGLRDASIDMAAAEHFWSSNYVQLGAHVEPGRGQALAHTPQQRCIRYDIDACRFTVDF